MNLSKLRVYVGTAVLLAGEYPETLVPANSGTAEQPIVFRAEPRRSARLIGNGDISYSILLRNLSHIRIEGNAISRVGHSPVYLSPRNSNRNIVMRGNVFHGARGRNFEHFAT
jgi:hypothetical protein